MNVFIYVLPALLVIGALAGFTLPQPETVPVESNVQTGDLSMEADTMLTMTRTRCFGPCPHYDLVVYTDGRVVYEGHAEVEVEGVVQDRLSKDQLNALRKAFDEADYFALERSYTTGPPCEEVRLHNPTVRTSYDDGVREHRVTHYRGCRGFEERDQLIRLENQIDQIIGTERWTGVSREVK